MKVRGKVLSLMLCGALAGTHAHAQNYPSKPLRYVIPYAAGGALDIVARAHAQYLSEKLGQSVVADNRPGASQVIAIEAVAKAPPDGHTLLMGTMAGLLFLTASRKSLPYDPFKDLASVSLLVSVPFTLAVHPSVPVTSTQELIDYAKKNPGKLSFGTTGTGSAYHLAGELIQLIAGVKFLHVPYKSSPQAITDLVAGRIDTAFSVYATTRQFVESGKLKNIALLNNGGFAALNGVPVVGDILPGFQSPPLWGGYFGPAGLPPAIISRLNGEMNKALAQADLRTLMERGGLAPAGGTPDQFGAMMKSDVERLQRIVKAAGIVPE